MRAPSVLLMLAIAAQLCAQPPTTDPHEDPRVNGGKKTGDSKGSHPDPKAVPDPVPVRAPDADSPPDSPAAGAKPLSDSEIMNRIGAALAKDPVSAASAAKVKVVAHAGRVTLEGTVPSAKIRHAVEQTATEIAGAGKVTNEVRIEERPSAVHRR